MRSGFPLLCHSEERSDEESFCDAFKAEEKILRFAQSEIHFALSLA